MQARHFKILAADTFKQPFSRRCAHTELCLQTITRRGASRNLAARVLPATSHLYRVRVLCRVPRRVRRRDERYRGVSFAPTDSGATSDEPSTAVVTASAVFRRGDFTITITSQVDTTMSSQSESPLGSRQEARSRILHRSATRARAHASQGQRLVRYLLHGCGTRIGQRRERCVGHKLASLPAFPLGRQYRRLPESCA